MSLKKSSYPFSKSKRFLLSHFIFIQGFFSFLLAINIGIYVSVITNKVNDITSHNFIDAFWEIRSWNILILFGLLIITIQSFFLGPKKLFEK